MPILEVESVTKMFGGLAAVRDLSFGVERGRAGDEGGIGDAA